jgi:tRNA (adenine37-N6)-methyltransferase
MEIKPIARFRSPFSSKFGIPKQAGLVAELEGQIVFEPEYRKPFSLNASNTYLTTVSVFSQTEK